MDELNGIDTSTIEELRRIKEEQQVLGERLQRMGERRGATTPAVFERVERDYKARHRGLEDRAKPLKEAARREFAKLEGLAKKIQQGLDVVKLDKEELEFRNSIGEYDQKTFEEGLRSVENKIAERQSELRACEDVRGQFLGAFPSEEDLRLPVPPPPQPPAAAPLPAPSPVSNPQTAPVAATPAPAAAPEPEAAAPVEDQAAHGRTAVVAAAPAEPAEEGGATRVLPLARLVLAKEDGSTEEFRLGAQTLVGRSPEAQVRIQAAAVSRKHSQVVLTPEGYKIVDLGSENGTYVNGSRVQEKVLQNGDRVQIGMARFVYRA